MRPGARVRFKDGKLKGCAGKVNYAYVNDEGKARVLVNLDGKESAGMTRYPHNASTEWCSPDELEVLT